MMTTPGSKLFGMLVDSKAEELIELMESTAPSLRAQVSSIEANEALVDALTYLENEKDASALSREIVARAKKLVLSRSSKMN